MSAPPFSARALLAKTPADPDAVLRYLDAHARDDEISLFVGDRMYDAINELINRRDPAFKAEMARRGFKEYRCVKLGQFGDDIMFVVRV